jgi:hypothetical protein
MEQTLFTCRKEQPKPTFLKSCEPVVQAETACNQHFKTTMMKNKLFLLSLLLVAFTFLYAATGSKSVTTKAETSQGANEETLHPLMIPGNI